MAMAIAELCAKDLMQSPVLFVHPGMSLVDLERLFLEKRIGGAPVKDQGAIVGVVSRSDIIRVLSLEQSYAEVQSQAFAHEAHVNPRRAIELIGGRVGERMQELKVRDAMTDVRGKVSPDATVPEIAAIMMKEQIHRVLVMEGDAVVGIVARMELIRLIAAGAVT